MQLLYNIAAILIVILVIPMFMIRAIRERGFVNRIFQSLGFYPEEALLPVANKDCIWVHAASVGEIVATSPLIKEFRKEFSETPILVSVVTTSGYEMANRIIKDADSIIYFPLDLPWLTKRVARRIHPSVFLPVETELWPNFLRALRELRIPVMMVNGRISDKSVKRYHYLRGILRDMISTVKMFAMQSPIDAEYIKRLGAPEELVVVTGNTKFDQTYTDVTNEEKLQMMKELTFQQDELIFVAGSTHRGEEEYILSAFSEVRKKNPKTRLLIAPRELLRVPEALNLTKNAGFSVVKRTDIVRYRGLADVVVLDTIGELGRLYAVGDVIFVGGSLIAHGGHNILEPAAHGKAIVVGPNMFNFKDTHALFMARNACITVAAGDELPSVVAFLFNDLSERQRLGTETLSIINENKGAARKSALILRNVLEQYGHEKIVHGNRLTQKITNWQTYFLDLVHQKKGTGVLQHCILTVLYLFSTVYRALVNLKLAGYKINVFHQDELGCFVISLGNVTVGGTGKTPTAQRLARKIQKMGYRVAILNRGYRAKWHGDVGVVSNGDQLCMDASEAGDEAYMLAKHLPNIPVLIGPERAVTGQYAIDYFGAEVVILDDGFQHWQLKRDLDIVLIDAVNVFGNEYMLPRGTLREPISHIERADVCLITKVDQAAEGSCNYIKQTVKCYNQNIQIVESIHQPRCFIPLSDWYDNMSTDGIDVQCFREKRVLAVSAIGNPASFEQTLTSLGAVIAESLRFPDHHDYTIQEMRDVLHEARNKEAEVIVITEKDAVKIPREIVAEDWLIKVYVLCVEVMFQNGAEEFFEDIQKKLSLKLSKFGRRIAEKKRRDAF